MPQLYIKTASESKEDSPTHHVMIEEETASEVLQKTKRDTIDDKQKIIHVKQPYSPSHRQSNDDEDNDDAREYVTSKSNSEIGASDSELSAISSSISLHDGLSIVDDFDWAKTNAARRHANTVQKPSEIVR